MEDIIKTESGLFEVHTDRSEHKVSGDFSYITFNDVDSGETLAIITAYNGHGSVINFPAYIDGYKVIQIAATDNIGLNIPDDMLNSIFEVDIPGSIENIGANAFSNCKNLKRVKFHNGLKRIGFGCFWCCESLEQLDIPDTVEVMECSTLYQTGIKEIKLPKEMKTVSDSLFQECRSLKRVVFPENVESIGWSFYDSNTALEEIVLSSGKIQYYNPHNDLSKTPWYKKQLFGWLYLGDCLIGYKENPDNNLDVYDDNDEYIGRKEIGFKIKKGIKKILYVPSDINIGEDVVIPDGVTMIGKEAFRYNEYIKNLTIPTSVNKIYDLAFCDTEKMDKLLIKSTDETVLDRFSLQGCGMTTLTIDGNVKTLEYAAITCCDNLKTVTIYGSIDRIEKNAIGENENCTSIVLGGDINLIDIDGFYSCENVNDVEIKGNIDKVIYREIVDYKQYWESKYPVYGENKEASLEDVEQGLFDKFENLRCIKVHTERMKNYCEQHNYPYEFIEDAKPAHKCAEKTTSSDNTAPAGKMKFCPFCGGKLVANAPFCAFCGEKIPVI